MAKRREEQRLALQGGMKAVSSIEGKGKPKVGGEELLALARRFGFSPKTLKMIREAVSREEPGAGPFLAKYYSDVKESSGHKFERLARQTFGVNYAIGISSGTAALHAAFAAVGVGPGTEVICPAIGFMATAAAVIAANGVPVFCDVDESLSMDPNKIADVITPRTVAIAPTCVMGSVPDMPAIMRVARKHKLKVVEDCAQSCGGSFKGRPVGTFGDVGCFAISVYKIIGGGEGGLIITDSKQIWERANQLAECGGLWRRDRFAPPRHDGELFPGTNYRMSELEATVDAVQLGKLTGVVRRFRAVKQRILKRLNTYREITPQKLNDPDGEVGYMLRFYPQTIRLGRRIVTALNAEGVSCGMRGENAPPDWHQYSWMYPIVCKTGHTDVNCPWECPVYRQAGGAVDYARGTCPVADDLFDRMITIPLNQWYSAADCRNIARAVDKVLSAYCTQDPAATKWF